MGSSWEGNALMRVIDDGLIEVALGRTRGCKAPPSLDKLCLICNRGCNKLSLVSLLYPIPCPLLVADNAPLPAQ